jgi:hypothetical protein
MTPTLEGQATLTYILKVSMRAISVKHVARSHLTRGRLNDPFTMFSGTRHA